MLRRMIFVPLLIVLAVLAIGAGVGYLIYNNYEFYNTDDAQVSGQLVNVSAVATGNLTSLNVKVGDTVTSGEAIGSVTPVTSATGATGTTGTPTSINVTSPIDGRVVQAYAVQGQAVSPGLPIVEVANLNALAVTAYVDESAISNVSNGQTVDIHVDAYSDTSFTGHVQQIVQSAASEFSLLPTEDNASGNFTKVSQRIPVVITLDGNGGKDIVPGMSAEVTIHLH
jgi:multidrug resistance efflux pump